MLEGHLGRDGLVEACLARAGSMAPGHHIMEFSVQRALSSLFSLLERGVRNIHTYNKYVLFSFMPAAPVEIPRIVLTVCCMTHGHSAHPDTPLDPDAATQYIQKYLVYAILWSFAGDAKLELRRELGEFIRSVTAIALPPPGDNSVVDYEPTLPSGDWGLWSRKVAVVEVETHHVRGFILLCACLVQCAAAVPLLSSSHPPLAGPSFTAGGRARCGHPYHRHGAARGPALLVAGRAQAPAALRSSRLRCVCVRALNAGVLCPHRSKNFGFIPCPRGGSDPLPLSHTTLMQARP